MLRFVRAMALPGSSEDWVDTCRTVHPTLFLLKKDILCVAGFFVGAKGVGVTVNHFYSESHGQLSGARVHYNNKVYEFEVVRRSEAQDLMVIRVKGERRETFPFLKISLDKCQVGDEVAAFGYNQMLERCFTPGYVLDPAYNLMKTVSILCLRSSCRSDDGYSGGPVTLRSGLVVGVHKANSNLFNRVKDSTAIPSSELASLLKEVAVETVDGWTLR